MVTTDKLQRAADKVASPEFELATGTNPVATDIGNRIIADTKIILPPAMRLAMVCLADSNPTADLMGFALHPDFPRFAMSLFVTVFELGRAYEQIDSLEKLMALESED